MSDLRSEFFKKKWKCCIPAWHGDKWSNSPIYAITADDAAETHLCDCNDENDVGVFRVLVAPWDESDTPPAEYQAFDVLAEAQIVYSAYELENQCPSRLSSTSAPTAQ